jgi:hypothetical protein
LIVALLLFYDDPQKVLGSGQEGSRHVIDNVAEDELPALVDVFQTAVQVKVVIIQFLNNEVASLRQNDIIVGVRVRVKQLKEFLRSGSVLLQNQAVVTQEKEEEVHLLESVIADLREVRVHHCDEIL